MTYCMTWEPLVREENSFCSLNCSETGLLLTSIHGSSYSYVGTGQACTAVEAGRYKSVVDRRAVPHRTSVPAEEAAVVEEGCDVLVGCAGRKS
jgi:hypothetical protein